MNVYIVTTVCVLLVSVSGIDALSGAAIARAANQYIGSTRWSYASSHTTGRNSNKCNIFIADVLSDAGGSVPGRWYGFAGPIGAGEWGNPRSSYLSSDSCWSNTNNPRIGDVMGQGVHVAIITGNRITTSADAYRVVQNDWGYRSNQANTRFAYWRYVC